MRYAINRKEAACDAPHSCENCGRECPGVAVIAACAEWMPAQIQGRNGAAPEKLTVNGQEG